MSDAVSASLLLQNMIWAGLVALGISVLFNVPRRALPGCALSGVVAYTVQAICMNFTPIGVEAATLFGATTVSFLGVGLGRYWRVPAPVFIIPGVIPLVPGAQAFRTMIDVLTLTTSTPRVNNALLLQAAANGLKTVLIVCAIAGGVALPSLLLRRHRPMT